MAFFTLTWVRFIAAILLTFAAKLTYDVLNRNAKARLPYPPGPKPKFLIGNALDFPKGEAGRKFTDWGKKYNSDILHASAFGQHIVVINNRKIAEDLFEKRAKIYNDRPEIPMTKYMGWECNIGLMRYGDGWRQHRKLCQQNFHPNAAKRFHPVQLDRLHGFLRSMLHEPEKVFDHTALLSISATTLMMYGYVPETLDDPIIHVADEGTRLAATLLEPGGTLVNILPVLRHIPFWVPGATGMKKAEQVRQLTEEMQRIPMEHVKAAFQKGTAIPSLMTDFLERKATVGILPGEETVINNVAWTVYGAASDTIISATGIFLFLVAKHVDVQRKAQEEIDRVIGSNRLPNHSDRPHLPYIEAIYREVLRYSQPLGIGAPHALTEDDTYKGYFLPKGTMVLANIWAMTHDEIAYPDPFSFKPERFFDENGKLNGDNRILAYGFGTRVCVGKSVASDFMWLIIVSILACLNIDKAKDDEGNDIEIDETFLEMGILTHKRPFKCSISPRSEEIRKLIDGTRLSH